ncbi:hypothetical protein [Methylocystis sp.]|uniref:hypothetical protein n=1 Tax=Methylocystis sp. TaxID=1911079 RepID=UPI0025CE06AC|nr:hypothetical protein [Methylocystis sp.]
MNITQLPAIMGTLLILTGSGLVVFEAIHANNSGRFRPPNVGDFGLSRWRFQTAYPGITMICVGALLLGVGAFAAH